MPGWTTIVQPETLAIALGREDVVVVDCRHSLANPGAGEVMYQQSHIPGAVFAHMDRDLSDMSKAGMGRHPWPDAATFIARLGEWGISPQHQVVAYDDGEGAQAARLWFLLRALGHEKVLVLDGGWRRCLPNTLLPVDSHVTKAAPTRYVGEYQSDRLLDAAQVQQRLAAGDLLIDARSADRFRGENETIDRVAGHVPGARNRPWMDNTADGRLKTPVQLAEEFRALLGEHTPDQTIVMCGSGVTACHHLLAMERAGLGGAKLFTGSWSGWIADPSRPIATGDA